MSSAWTDFLWRRCVWAEKSVYQPKFILSLLLLGIYWFLNMEYLETCSLGNQAQMRCMSVSTCSPGSLIFLPCIQNYIDKLPLFFLWACVLIISSLPFYSKYRSYMFFHFRRFSHNLSPLQYFQCLVICVSVTMRSKSGSLRPKLLEYSSHFMFSLYNEHPSWRFSLPFGDFSYLIQSSMVEDIYFIVSTICSICTWRIFRVSTT